MALKVKRVQIENFRGLKEADVVFPEHCIVLGANNSGKTAIVEAIALTLGREKLIHYVDDYDFHGGFAAVKEPLAQRFFIKVVITGFATNDARNYPEWFNTKNAGPEAWWDEQERKLLHQRPNDSQEAIGRRFFLAAEIGCCGYYDDEECEYRTIRYFIDGKCDPAAGDPYSAVPVPLLRELGVFFLPSQRTWDKTLTFNASSFIKLLRENDAVPGEIISDLRRALAGISPAPEGHTDKQGVVQETEFGRLIDSVESELKKSGLIENDKEVKLLYRPTELDVRSILASLVPHVKDKDGNWIPLERQGSGVLALQNLLLLTEFARRRKSAGRGFIFLVEEPELHLFPALQQKVTQLARGLASQTIITTHSPHVAGAYAPGEVIVIKTAKGTARQEPLLPNQIDLERRNLVKEYFYNDRLAFCGAIMGSTVVVPEGKTDANWFALIRALAERYDAELENTTTGRVLRTVGGFTVIRTKDSRVEQTVAELQRLGCDTLPVVDGDAAGRDYVTRLFTIGAAKVVRWADDDEIEDVVSWVIEPCLPSSEGELKGLLDETESLNRNRIANLLKGKFRKDVIRHEELMSIAGQSASVRERAWKLACDISSMCEGRSISDLLLKWEADADNPGCAIFKYV